MISMDIETGDSPVAVSNWSYEHRIGSNGFRGLLTTKPKSVDLFGETTVKSEPVNDFGEEAEKSLFASELNRTFNYIPSVNKQRESRSPKSVAMAKAISPKDLLKVQCVICKEAIVMQKFQRHIASCGKSNRPMQDLMEMRLKQILGNFNVITQRKVNCLLQMEGGKEQSETLSESLPANERRSRRDSAARPDCHSLRRGRSKSVFKDTSLNSTQQSRSNMNGKCNSMPTTPVSACSSLAKVADETTPSWPIFNKPEAQSETSLLLQNTTLSCSLCSYTTDRKSRLQKHEWTHRMKKTQVLQCFYCSQRYTIGALAMHIRQVHTGQAFRFRTAESSMTQPTLTCSECRFQCHLQIQLNSHLKKVHSVGSQPCAPPPTKQLTVLLKKEDLEALKRRLARSARPKTRAIQSTTMRLKHLNSKRLDKASFSCTKCDFVTARSVCYSAHLQTHAYQRNVNCECGFESTRMHLRMHRKRCAVALELGEKPKVRTEYKFSCKRCSAQFSRIGGLRCHMGTHKKNQPIEKCGSCNYQSTHRCLLTHMKRSKHYTVGEWGMGPSNEKSHSIGKSDPVEAATEEKTPTKSVCLNKDKALESSPATNASAVAIKAPNLLLYGSGFQPDQPASPKSTATIGTDAGDEFSCKVEACYEEEDLDEGDQDGLRLIKCTLCSYFSTNEISYKRHVASHISRNFPLFKCQFCTFTAARSNFRYHRSRCAVFRKLMRSWKAPQKYMLHCAACSFTTYFPEDLNRHMYICTNQVEG